MAINISGSKQTKFGSVAAFFSATVVYLFVLVIFFADLIPFRGEAAGAEKSKEVKSPPVEIKIRELDPKAAAQVSYARDIKPILSDACYDCHSPDDSKGGLDLTSYDHLFVKGKKAGPPVVAGKPDESAMVQYVRGLREPQMPKGNPALTEDNLNLIRLWILAGAVDDTSKVGADKLAAVKKPSVSVMPMTNNFATQAAISTLLFDDNFRDRLLAQRTIRMGYLPPSPIPPKVKSPTFNQIDQFIVAKWEKDGLKEAKRPPPVCDDTVFLRRVYLDIIGIIPTVAEAKAFLADKAKDKRVKLVDELLARKEAYAANWTPFWVDAIASADVNISGGIPTRGNHRQWIYNSFLENKPYDVFVAELLDPLMPNYREVIVTEANSKRITVGYVRNDSHEETVLSAANTAQLFLGTSMKCASCHNHFLNKEWPQSRFMAFAGMFATNDLELIRCEKKSGNFIKAEFPFELPDVPNDMPKTVNERMHRMTQLLVDPTNPRFAKAMVNRLWKRYIGIPLFAPVDDFRLDQPASQPELLEWLADDFIRSGYDLKHSVRLILTSRTYQLKYDPKLEDRFDVALPSLARYYRSPSLRRLSAEELMDSMRVAITQQTLSTNRLYLSKKSTELSRAFGKPPAHSEISTSRPEDFAVVQALEVLNGNEFRKLAYSTNNVSVTMQKEKPTQQIDQMYWETYSRPATSAEKKLGANFLKVRDPNIASQNERLGDVLWALLSSPEFQYLR